MDVKGLAWIGNIYEKFEAMCLEMEEVMYEDTVKYVENQVQTVGATVKRFYSDVMQDMHPESHINPVKVAAADLSLNPYAHSEMKQKTSAKKDGKETDWKLPDESKVISGKANTGVYRRPIANRKGNSKGNLAPLLPPPIAPISEAKSNLSSFTQLKRSREVSSGHVDIILPSAHFEGVSKSTNGKNSKSMVDTVLPISRASVNSPATAGSAVGTEQKQSGSASMKVDCPSTATTIRSTASTGLKKADYASTSVNSPDISTIQSVSTTGQKQADCASTCSSGGLSSECSDAGTCVKNGVVSQTGETVYDLTDNGKIFAEDIILAHQDRLDGCSTDAAKNDDALDSEVEIIEPLNDSILEETCVMVEGDKLHAFPQGKGGRKSYKKKLREAFSSKMRLTKKEYEQLAAKYMEEESDQGTAERVSPDRTVDSSSRKMSPPPAHSSETDWELV